MAKVNVELGKLKVIAPDKEAEISVEGIKLSAEYSADELNVIKSMFESALGIESNSGLKLEIEEIKNVQVTTNNLLKDMIGSVMGLFNNQNTLNEKQVGMLEKVTSILGKMFGVKPEQEDDAITAEELETRKQKVEFYKSGV